MIEFSLHIPKVEFLLWVSNMAAGRGRTSEVDALFGSQFNRGVNMGG